MRTSRGEQYSTEKIGSSILGYFRLRFFHALKKKIVSSDFLTFLVQRMEQSTSDMPAFTPDLLFSFPNPPPDLLGHCRFQVPTATIPTGVALWDFPGAEI